MSIRALGLQPFPPLALKITLCVFLAYSSIAHSAHGQVTQSESEHKISTTRANSGEVDASDVETIARAKAVQSIPALEAQFARETDLTTKMKIADGLVRLGEKNNVYWDFLLQRATLAVDSDLPDPFHDSQGNPTGRELSPEFKAWVQAHNADVIAAVRSWTYDLPIAIAVLSETGDPRGIPLLQRALQSHNYQIVAWAATGLALIQDKQSIPLIVAAAKSAPPEYTSLIAESLVYFDDAQAQNAVDRFMPKDKAISAREARAHGRGVIGW